MLLATIYQQSILLVLYALALTILFSCFFIKKDSLVQSFGKIKRRHLFLLILIFIVGLAIRLLLMPKVHLMYIDEPLYIDQAHNINAMRQIVSCTYVSLEERDCWFPYSKAPGWPFLLSLVYLVTGTSESAAFHFNAILGSLCVIVLFFVAYLITKDGRVALWSSLFMALSPLHVKWSATIETNIASLFLSLLVILAFLIYLEQKKIIFLWFSTLLLIFCILVRFEMVFLVFILLLAYTMLSQKRFIFFEWLNSSILFLMALVVLFSLEVFLVPLFKQISMQMVLERYLLNLLDFLDASTFHFLYLALFFIGALLTKFRIDHHQKFLIYGIMLVFVIYAPIFFQDRMALLPAAFMMLLASLSLESIIKRLPFNPFSSTYAAVALALLLFGSPLYAGLLHTRSANEHIFLEMKTASHIKQALPEQCYLISEYPMTVLFGTDLKGMQMKTALDRTDDIKRWISKGECFYFLADAYCTESKLSKSFGSRMRCDQIIASYTLLETNEFTRGNIRYHLYKIIG